MFTVKCMRVDQSVKPERERMHIYEAVSVDILRNADGLSPGEAYVIFRQPNGDEPAITVTWKDSEGGYPARVVIIENSAGNTTDVVRPVRRKS